MMIPSLSAPVAAPKQITPQPIQPVEPEELRAAPEKDTPTGPPPSFEESFLARQAREALKPEDLSATPDTKGTPYTRAEASFSEIRAMSAEPGAPLLDMRS